MPGKWAAPPAPAMITLIPLFEAVEANLTNRSGVLCAETTVSSKGMPNSVNWSAAATITGRSLSLPMMMLTIGFFLLDALLTAMLWVL
jgi:pseudouridine-5'-phosphate glycosidase